MKYTAKPSRSLEVVIKGPEANAGLIPNLFNANGVTVPINEANITTQKSEIETTIANSKLSPKK